MDINRRLIGTSAVCCDGKVVDVDISGLIRKLLLFDKFVLTSVRLQEFPILAKRLGYEPLRDLLDARLIEIRCECLQLAQIGQSGLFGDPILPPFSYKFNWIDLHDREKYIHDGLQGMHESSGLQHKEVVKIKRSIVDSIKQLPPEVRPSLFPPFRNELLNNTPLVKRSIELSIRKSRSITSSVPFSFQIHENADDEFTVETDLAQRLNVDAVEAHKIVEAGLLGLSAMTQAIGEMKAYSAISGFRDEELPLFRDKLDFLVDAFSSRSKEGSFQRVITIAGLPELPSGNMTINIDQLFKVRDSKETREFRDWLATVGDATDAEIRERVATFSNSFGIFLGKAPVKAIKTLVLSAVGCIPYPAISATATAIGLLDHFLLEKLFPRSGIAAFVNELYPSIFEKRDATESDIVQVSEGTKTNSAVSDTLA